MRTQTKAYIFAFLAIFCWSTVATAFKLALRGMDFLQLVGIIAGVTVIFLFILVITQNKLHLLRQTTKKDVAKSAFFGFLNPFLYYVILLKAYTLIAAQMALTLNYIWPVVLVLLSIPLLKQSIGFKSIMCVLISFFGVVIIANRGSFSSLEFTNPIGVGLALGSSIIWALFWIFNVRDGRDDVVKLLFNFCFGFIYILIIVILFSDFKLFETSSLLPAIYLGMAECGLAFVFWLKAMKLSSSTDKISNLVFLSPFISLIFIYIILGESIYFSTLVGLILIISGILLQQLIKRSDCIEK